MIEAQGPLKKIKPLQRVEPCAQAKCAYCGRYGILGQCAGCGASNQPIKQERETTPIRVPLPPFPISWY